MFKIQKLQRPLAEETSTTLIISIDALNDCIGFININFIITHFFPLEENIFREWYKSNWLLKVSADSIIVASENAFINAFINLWFGIYLITGLFFGCF